jgi:hypothetical protein
VNVTFNDEFGSVWREAAIFCFKIWGDRGNSQNTLNGLLTKNEPQVFPNMNV